MKKTSTARAYYVRFMVGEQGNGKSYYAGPIRSRAAAERLQVTAIVEMGQQDVPESEKIWLALMVYTASQAAVYRDARNEENTVPRIPVNIQEFHAMLAARRGPADQEGA